ncbi:hypothetical protein [Streptomyces sp. TRM64462]|uniref:hypothetical protein n=1 Tax=Streptomyces sp. TRM64462 TaxID=2741726 RepID=UPI001585FEA4|nr:hypothetical protein [Streptomyces sp. TRM64462]
MIELADPQLIEQDLELLPGDAVRGDPARPDDEKPPLAGRIKLGGPEARRLTPDWLAADPELARYHQEQSHVYDFFLLTLSVTFVSAAQRPRLEFAHVGLSLTTKPGAPEPIAHSMDPMRRTDAVQVTRTRRLGPQLSLLGADASLGEMGRTVGFTTHQPWVEALGLHAAEPAWEFRRTVATELSGCHVLSAVIRTGAGAATDVACTVTAGVKIPLLRRYHRKLRDPLRLEVAL